MARGQPTIEHLFRRAGFGASAAELLAVDKLAPWGVVDYLSDYERRPADVDSKIGDAAYANVTTRAGAFSPNTNIEDARQRWIFRMVHSQRPLQEKMALFWHNHFATAYSKIAGMFGPIQGTKMLALVPGQLPGPQGQLELFRQYALGNFRDLLIEVAKDPAMLVWLDGQVNTRLRPQENFGREIMELFTRGVGTYTEQDVYAAARVFTGWNLRRVGTDNNNPNVYYEFVYNAALHDLSEKTFTFPIYRDGSKTIPARSSAEGMQDGIDFITALAFAPETARRLAGKLWTYFVSEEREPEEAFLNSVSQVYLRNNTEMRPVVEYVLRSSWFLDPANWYTRYSWPAEYVARAVKEVGWSGFSVDAARTATAAMGQTLFEPPDVNGWELGEGWFSTGRMLARMNFASALASNQRFNLARDAGAVKASPDDVVSYFLARLSPAPYDSGPSGELRAYMTAGTTWTGSDAQLQTKGAGLVRLIVGSAQYQLV